MAKRLNASGSSSEISTKPHDVGGMAKFLQDNVGQIAASCSAIMRPENVIRLARTMFHKSPALLECDPISILGGVIQSAALGLELDEFTGAAYLVPFWNGKRQVKEAQLIIGYRGLMRLARRSGEVTNIEAREVRVGDKFEVSLGTDAKIVHVPTMSAPAVADDAEDEAQFVAFYMTADIKGAARPQFDWMALWEILAIRDAVRKKNNGNLSPAWLGHFAEMGKKSVVRRGAKYLPVSPEAQQAIALDDLAAHGIRQDLAAIVDRSKLVAGGMVIPVEPERTQSESSANAAADFELKCHDYCQTMESEGVPPSEIVEAIKRVRGATMATFANDVLTTDAIAKIAQRYIAKYSNEESN